MSTQIATEHFVQAIDDLLDETFDNVHGIFFDKGTSMFETLATISPAEASIPVAAKCATLAAQVKHTAFYLEEMERIVRSGKNEPADWGEIWRTTTTVTPDEWEAIKARLRTAYYRIRALIADTPTWPDEDHVGGVIATVVHTAYHLGEIRQALCILKP